MLMADNVIREIHIPENDSTILVYANGVAIISPKNSAIRTVWREKAGAQQMHHVLEWSRGLTKERFEQLKADMPIGEFHG
jgi:hypothetical protein